MALPGEDIEIPLKGLAQKHDAKMLPDGALSLAENVRFDKAGALNKRKGYQRIAITGNVALGGQSEEIFTNVATYKDELLAFGITDAFSLASHDNLINGQGWINRGPAIRGTVEKLHIASGTPHGEIEAEGGDPADDIDAAFLVLEAADQVDVATVEYDGVFYRCYSWLNLPAQAIEAALFSDGEQGQSVLVGRWVVESFADNGSTFFDSPKIINAFDGRYFIVHYITDSSSTDLHRKYLDLDAIVSGFQTPSGGISIGIADRGLYDVHSDRETGDFFLVYASSATDTHVIRYTDLGWLQYSWNITRTTNHEQFCLGCFVDSGDRDTAFVLYQGTDPTTADNRLVCETIDWADGSITDTDVLMANLEADVGAVNFANVGMCRVGADLYVIVCEWELSTQNTLQLGSRVHGVAYTTINNHTSGAFGTDEVGNHHWCWNLGLNSRPWAYADGDDLDGLTSNVYCCVSFTSSWALVQDGDGPHDQQNGFIVNLMRNRWGASDNGRCHPLPVAVLNDGTFDARPSTRSISTSAEFTLGPRGRRMNHLGHVGGAPSFGPLQKTRVIAHSTFSRLAAAAFVVAPNDFSFLKPDKQEAKSFRIRTEEPWVYHRDRDDPGEPSENFNGVYPWVNCQSSEIGDGLVGGGGCPWVYDGEQIVENNYCWYPEIVGADEPEGTGPEAGDHIYTAVYEWTDLKGQLHQSRPATPVTITKAEAADDAYQEVWVRSINMSMKDHSIAYPNARGISVVLYRFSEDTGVFHRTNPTRAPANDTDFWYTVCPDFATDAELARQSQLPYAINADGSFTPLEPIQPPNGTVTAAWKNRQWIATDQGLWYSGEVLPQPGGTGYSVPEFNATRTFRLDDIGQVTAIQALDNVLLVFTRDRTWAVQGEGVDDNGNNSSLTIQPVAMGVGCIEPRSVVLGPDGVFFQSAKGYYLIDRSLQANYLASGANVEEEIRTAGNVRSASIIQDRHEVRLVTNDAVTGACRVLVYDYLAKQWSKSPLPNLRTDTWQSSGAGGVAWYGRENESNHVVLQQGALAIERASGSASEYADQNAAGTSIPVPILVRTGWIHMAGVAGFKRVREIGIQLSKTQASSINVSIEYDIDGSFTDGANQQDVFFASPAPSFLRVRTRVQKCSAIRVTISESGGSLPQTENVKVTSITINIARKKGTRRVSASASGVDV